MNKFGKALIAVVTTVGVGATLGYAWHTPEPEPAQAPEQVKQLMPGQNMACVQASGTAMFIIDALDNGEEVSPEDRELFMEAYEACGESVGGY